MAKRRKTPEKSKVRRYDESVPVQMPAQAGLRLEQWCEEWEVGIDYLIHWNDATLEETDIYSLTGLGELDVFHLGQGYTVSGFHRVPVLSPVAIKNFQYLFKIMKVDESHLSLSNVYPNTGSFRYAEPEESTREVGMLNLVFNDMTNIGFAARGIQF
ncbi:MAG: hypothetical protein ABFD82_22400 [Syntrophaceae bacterium]